MLAKAQGLEWRRLQKLGELQAELKVSLEKMLELVDDALHPEPYTREEICKTLGISTEELCENILSTNTQHGKTSLKDSIILCSGRQRWT